MAAKTGHGEKYSRKAQAAIGALLESSSLPEASEKCGVSPRTLRRWLANPEFEKAYGEARSRLLENAINCLRVKSLEASNVLVSISNDREAPAAVRVSAARAIISLAIGSEVLELEERLSELEELAKR
jgi:hypothetical protein